MNCIIIIFMHYFIYQKYLYLNIKLQTLLLC